MKFATKKKKQLESVKHWTSVTRKYYNNHDMPNMTGYFYVLIAVEQLVKYLEMEENGE
jgi:hypothetical protein